MKMAAQSLLQEYNVLGCGARRALWNSGSRLVFARPQSSLGSIATCAAGPERRALTFGVGRLPYSSQLSVASEGGRKVSTGAAAVRLCKLSVAILSWTGWGRCCCSSQSGVGSWCILPVLGLISSAIGLHSRQCHL